MEKAAIIGIDLAKRVFQAHGATRDGEVAFRKKLSRSPLLTFLAAQPQCVVAMEACASAHDWGCAIAELGHTVRLVPPVYVKPFVKRQKNDAADAEAIAEAASRPTMRFVVVKNCLHQTGHPHRLPWSLLTISGSRDRHEIEKTAGPRDAGEIRAPP